VKISLNRKAIIGPWGGGNQFLNILCQYLIEKGFSVSFSIDEDTEVILIIEHRDHLMCFSVEEVERFKRSHPNIKIIQRVNDNSLRSLDEKKSFNRLATNIHLRLNGRIVFVSNWLRDYYAREGFSPEESNVIWNASDRKIFSYFNRERISSDPIKAVSHHWSNNLLKGFDVYDEIDGFCHLYPDQCNFMYLGNFPTGYLKHCNIIRPQPYKEIPKYLSPNDIYVTASFAESGGNHIIEGMSCGLIPFVKFHSGSCVEYSKGFGYIYNTTEELISQIMELRKNFGMFVEKKEKMKDFSYNSEEMCKSYLDIINS